ncbi:MAG: hypothetical protein IKB04_02105 [Clostridia bacterium]|nr:hypothetical protein [Clostridia bacterium]
MKGKKLLALLIACVALLVFTFAVSAAPAADFTGWDYDDDWNYVYWVNGEMVTDDWVEDGDYTYYVGEDGQKYANGIFEIGGAWYGFDESGVLYKNTTFYISKYNEDMGYWDDGYYYAKPNGVLARNQWSLIDNSYYVYYGNDCARICNQVATINGKLYGFDGSGALYVETAFELYDRETDEWEYYYAQDLASHDGALLTNRWHQTYLGVGDERWFYYGADGKSYNDGVAKIGNKYYYFYSSGAMGEEGPHQEDHWDEELEEWVADGAYRAREDGSLYVNSWYEEYGSWYYYGAEGKAPYGLATVGGKTYCFDEWGCMLQSEARTFVINGVKKHYVADENGTVYEVQNNNWRKVDENWYYVQNDEICSNGIYRIGSKYYGFDYSGRMYDNEWFELDYWEDEHWMGVKNYYAQPDGELPCNTIVEAERYGLEGLYLFGADCSVPNAYGLYEFQGKTYYLYSYGRIATNVIEQAESGVYRFGENGVGTKLNNGWHFNNTSLYEDEHYWFYLQNDVMLSGGIHQIGSKRYAFDYNGRLETNDIYYDEEIDKYWLLTYMDKNGNGGSVCEEKNVWKTVNGYYVYLSGDSTLHEGWLFDTYYMGPYMTYCTYTTDADGYAYVVNVAGQAKKVTTTGFLQVGYGKVYVQNGKVVTSNWVPSGGAWYYFDEYGLMLSDTSCEIKGVCYFFDANGKMYDKGWVCDSMGNWYWAASSGALFRGVDSAGYVFDNNGKLVVDAVAYINDKFYVTDQAGKSIGTFNKDGWNQVGSDWYYAASNEGAGYRYVLTGSFYDGYGRFYAFDTKGRMLKNQFYENNNYYLGSDGAAAHGWRWINGSWYYGDPENNGYLYRNGVYRIGDKEYVFDDYGALKCDQTFFCWDLDAIVTTDKDGVIINQTAANGWVYDTDSRWGYGEAYYYVNGVPYTGWLGKYYLEYGEMAINRAVYDEDADAYYCVDKKGLKVGYGWYELWEREWVFAREDGKLICDEWLPSGGKWYYFDGTTMAWGGVYEIEGELHIFDDNGVWLGEYKENAGPDVSKVKDGWYQHNGEWYFVMAGEVVTDQTLYIGNKWYAFDYNGVMISNRFYMPFWVDSGFYYFTADGSSAEYTGWKWINNAWVYFNSENVAVPGWVYDGGKYYYQDFGYNDRNQDIGTVAMVTGYHVIDDVLYYFNNGGVLTKTVTARGWYQSGSDWYFVDWDGKAVTEKSEYMIGGAYYAFDWEGKMIADAVFYDRYYNANGVMITKAGWYVADGKWIYVKADGRVAYEGVFRIGGKDYYFHEYVWVA